MMLDILEVVKQSEAFENFVEVVKNNRELTVKDEIDKIYNEKTNKGKTTYKSYEDALLSIAEVEQTEDGYQISLKCRIGQDQGKKYGYAIFSVIARPVQKILQLSGKSVKLITSTALTTQNIADLKAKFALADGMSSAYTGADRKYSSNSKR